jgi:hypothetical protein
MMDDLNTFADKFKKWRGNRRHLRYPSDFWEEIQCFIQHYGIQIVANAIKVNPSYLRHKIRKSKKSQAITFTPLKVSSLPFNASIEFIDRTSRPMIIRFQSNSNQLIQMIRSLSGDQK